MSQPLPAGTHAPDFLLNSTPDQKIARQEFKGQPLVLVFYPADWSPVCTDQLAIYTELMPEFKEFGAQVVGISVDGPWCHQEFRKQRRYGFRLLADFEPKGEVARKYGVYRDGDGVAERALFVINPEGMVHWSYVSPIGINPGADGILRALGSLSPQKVVQHA